MNDLEQILNVLLYDLPITQNPNDLTARVKLNGIYYNSVVAKKIAEHWQDFHPDAILGILNMASEIRCAALAAGYSVIDGFVQARPSVGGIFNGKAAQFDPKVNTKGAILSASPELRKAVNASKVVVLGPALTGPVINTIEDVYSASENTLITPGRNLRIHGQNLRIAGDDPAVGVWFIDETSSTRTSVDKRDVVDNDPSTLTILTPALPQGNYFVEVVTQSGTSLKTVVKEPRSYRFEVLMAVE
jgi:hypothetical protein